MHSEYSGQTPRDRHSLKSEEQWRRVSRQNVSCLKLEHTFLTVGAVHQRPMSEPFTSTGETASLSWDPVISSGRRETSQTAALIPSWKVSADWVRTTKWGPLRTFIYIWRERVKVTQFLQIQLGSSKDGWNNVFSSICPSFSVSSWVRLPLSRLYISSSSIWASLWLCSGDTSSWKYCAKS